MFAGNHWTPLHKYVEEGDIFDYGECHIISYILTYLYLSFATILLLSAIILLLIFIYKAIYDYKHMNTKSFILGILFVLISITLIPLSTRNILMVCYHHVFSSLNSKHLLSWFGILYSIQIYLLWFILFMRLHVATIGGRYKFNKNVLISFKIIFSIYPILTVCYMTYLIIHEFQHTTSRDIDEKNNLFIAISMLSIIMIFSIIIPIILTVLFTSKLMNIYKETNKLRPMDERKKHDKIIPVITRTTILAIISVSITLLTMISFFIHVVFSCYMGLLDIYSNFICIMFAYKHFRPYYDKICSPLDAKCRNICFNVMNNDDNQYQDIQVNPAENINENEMFIRVDGRRVNSIKSEQILEEIYEETVEGDDEDKIIEINEDLETNTVTSINCFNGEIEENDGTNNMTAHSVNSYGAYTESVQSTKISDIETTTTCTE